MQKGIFMKYIELNQGLRRHMEQMAKEIGWEFREGEVNFKNLKIEVCTGQTAKSVLNNVKFPLCFQSDEAKRILGYARELFPYMIYDKNGKMKPSDVYVLFYNIGSNKNSRVFVMVKDLYEHDEVWFSNEVLSKLGTANVGMSFCTFTKKCAREVYIYSVNAIVVDIDCDKAGYVGETGHYKVEEQLFGEYFDTSLPSPTYIEEGRNLRLIYVLDTPRCFPGNRKFRNFVKFLMGKYSDILKDFGADKQKINSFVRVDGSANTKGRTWRATEVKWRKIGDKVDFEELTWFLPEEKNVYRKEYCPLPKNHSGKKKINHFCNNFTQHNRQVLDVIEYAQNMYNQMEDEGHREVLCFLYRNYHRMYYGSMNDAEKAMLEFNKNFNVPLPEKELLSATHNSNYRIYYYRNKNLLRAMGIDSDIMALKMLSGFNKKEYNKQYYQKHKKSNKELDNRRRTIKTVIIKLKNQAKSNVEVAEELLKKNICLAKKTIEWYVTKFRKSGEICKNPVTA